jgi:hypothetical protein
VLQCTAGDNAGVTLTLKDQFFNQFISDPQPSVVIDVQPPPVAPADGQLLGPRQYNIAFNTTDCRQVVGVDHCQQHAHQRLAVHHHGDAGVRQLSGAVAHGVHRRRLADVAGARARRRAAAVCRLARRHLGQPVRRQLGVVTMTATRQGDAPVLVTGTVVPDTPGRYNISYTPTQIGTISSRCLSAARAAAEGEHRRGAGRRRARPVDADRRRHRQLDRRHAVPGDGHRVRRVPEPRARQWRRGGRVVHVRADERADAAADHGAADAGADARADDNDDDSGWPDAAADATADAGADARPANRRRRRSRRRTPACRVRKRDIPQCNYSFGAPYNGTWVLSYTCTKIGLYQFDVTLNGISIKGRPGQLLVTSGKVDPSKCRASAAC